MNIFFVAHIGDIVNNADNTSQWDRADTAMAILDADGIPYGTLPGNHDFIYPTTNLYEVYFPSSRFSAKTWWGGQIGTFGSYDLGESNNNFQLVEAGGYEFIFLNLQYLEPSLLGSDADYDAQVDEVIAWANGVLTAHSNRKAIVSTHDFLNNSATRSVNGDKYWDELITLHDNVRLVLSGHGQVKRFSTKNSFGSTVWAIQQNWQTLGPTGGNGYLRYYVFKPSEDTIEIFTYSTYSDILANPQFLTDDANQFVINYIF